MLWLTLVCAGVLSTLAPAPAQAYDFYEPDLGFDPYTAQFGDEICPGPGLMRRIMPCIKESMLNVTNEMLIPFSEYMADTVTVICALAVALLGALMIGGKTTAPFKDSLVLIVKLGAVSMFSYNFGGMFGAVLDGMDELLALVTYFVMFSGAFGGSVILQDCPDYGDPLTLLVWDAVDCSLNSLFGGITSDLSLSMGITGFLLSCLTSNTLGVTIGLLGIRLMLQLIWAVIRSLYIYLTAYMGICLMVLISPIFIPAILFQATRGYFERWLRIFMSFIIQPVILFAYLAMLLTAFDMVIFSGPNSLYAVIAGSRVSDPDFRVPMDEGGQVGIGGWLWSNGGYWEDKKMPFGIIIDSKGTKEKVAQLKKRDRRSMEEGAVETGALGVMGAKLVTPIQKEAGMNIDKNQQRNILKSMGLGEGGGDLNLFEFSFPFETVDWGFLAEENGYDSTDPEQMLSYMIKVFIAFLMALITGYVFIELLDTLPFVGSGLAMGSGVVDEKSLGMSGMAKMGPLGNDPFKNLKGK